MANGLVDLLLELQQRGDTVLCMLLSAGCGQSCPARESQLDQFHVLKRADDFESTAELKPVGMLCRSEIIFHGTLHFCLRGFLYLPQLQIIWENSSCNGILWVEKPFLEIA